MQEQNPIPVFPNIRSKKCLAFKYVTPELWNKLAGHVTNTSGFTLSKIINCSLGFDNQYCGMYAGDYDCYKDFAEVFDPAIQEYHGVKPGANHTSDMDVTNIIGNIDEDVPVQAVRLRVCRNISGFGLSPGMCKEQRDQVQILMISAFKKLSGDLSGNYYPLAGMDGKVRQKLVDDHFLFMSGDPNFKVAGIERDWPDGRGIFHNSAKSFLVWVNEEDHLKITSMEMGGDLKGAFARLAKGIISIGDSVKADSGREFHFDSRLGYVTSCPTNLGTGIWASIKLDLPGWAREGAEVLRTRCEQLKILPRITTDCTFDISNKYRMGYSEVQIIQSLIDAINILYKEEIQLQQKHKIFPYFPVIKSKSSLVAKHVNEVIFKRLGSHKTETTAFTIHKAIRCATMFHNQHCGIYAGDWDSYRDFAAVFDPIIQEYHGITADVVHTSDMDHTKIEGNIDPTAPVHSVRIRVGRSIDGFGLSPGITREQRLAVECLMKSALHNLSGDLEGQYYPLMGMPETIRQQLVDNHFLFMSGDPNLKVAGMERDWPEGRGIFHNSAKTFLVWINEEDQIMIISMEKGGDVQRVFERLVRGIKSVEESLLRGSGKKFALDQKYGYVHSCPTNLGTGMRASVHVDLPGWKKEGVKALNARCEQLKLQLRPAHGESTGYIGCTYDVSNKHRLGYSEVELVQCMINGVNTLHVEDIMFQKKHGVSLENKCEQSIISSIDNDSRCLRRISEHSGTKAFAGRGQQLYINIPHVIVMVGLPARGKTYMARKLSHYLNWIGIKTRVFNLGDYRRKAVNEFKDHNFFKTENEDALKLREKCANDALQDLCNWIQNEGGEVGVYDATNSTMARRSFIYRKIVGDMQFKCFFVESICDDPKIIEENIFDVKVNSPDYKEMNDEDAFNDFMLRIAHYESQYQTLDEIHEESLSFMKLYNAGNKVVINKSDGHIQARIIYFFMNIHINPRNIYLSRHGESLLNAVGRIGGNADLSDRGLEYSKSLSKYIESQHVENLRVWTSYFKRTMQTASHIDAPQERWKALNEIDSGACEELTYQEIADKFPAELAARDENKYHYRYPRGESYEDLVARLEPVIMELERQKNVLVISHQAVLRCLLGYFFNKSAEDIPYIKVPLHTIIKLTPMAYGCHVEYIPLGIKAVDTYRPKPKISGTVEAQHSSSDEFFEDYLY
ncbi:unnamed protein product [Meganyctiphanes norvegica]|uniref:6-phosphofructo-2-kinase n=1 Tax=Meganyctiphanes norvegica TaxID=48144 RepID=A0AAV2QKK8_MEGNR